MAPPVIRNRTEKLLFLAGTAAWVAYLIFVVAR